ncbi:hypothetical protein GCM10022254_27940 [Actinomadura meridiana]|uniref:Integral membrane protein n=1 Tax=Actinomadura meridiana TaxID=559626 RepID=A0ABP8BZY3_9ACTN
MLMPEEHFALPNPRVLLVILLVGAVVTLWLVSYVIRRLYWYSLGYRRSPGVGVRCLTAVVAAAAIGMYVWGALHLVIDKTTADQECKAAVGAARAGDVDRYEPSFVPLGFGCHVAGGGSYEAAVPGYVNPAVAVLGFTAVTLAVCAAVGASQREEAERS